MKRFLILAGFMVLLGEYGFAGKKGKSGTTDTGIDSTQLREMTYRCIGPFRGGRSAAVTGVPGNSSLYYMGATGGGVWRSTNAGNSWENISDGFFGGSIGAIAVAESDPNVIYVGGGEVTVRGNVSHGEGIWKSTDAGKTWKNMGLKDSRHVPRIRIHPKDHNVVFVAALGHLFGPNKERGVFKSTDGGESWAVPTVLNDDIDPSSHQFYPSLHVNEQGTVIVSWYDRRDDDNNINTHYYMTYSTDGGESFEPNFAVSTATSDFTAIGDKNGGFGIGEYTQVIASSAYAIPVWSDGRNNDGNIDLFVAFVPLYDQALGFDQLSTISPEFSVRGPHPNPVSGEAILKLNLQQSSVIELEVHRLDGQLVQKYAPYNFPSGESELRVETHNLSDGIYTVTIRTDFGYLAKKMIVTGE